ncbi:MAG: hypothetical protein WKF71_08100 [Pyrinomonadaceae bacterium]
MKKTTFIFLTISLLPLLCGFGQADTKTRSEKAKPVYIEDRIDARNHRSYRKLSS